METASTYDLRSLQHERRMLDVYRRGVRSDAALLEPLANACRRAAAFEWAVHRDADVVRRLWAEGARALAHGFLRRRTGFEPGADQLMLGLHLSLAAEESDALNSLADAKPARQSHGGNAARARACLAEGYALVARAIIARRSEPARAAVASLDAARVEREWWERQYPGAREAAWRVREHEALCSMLKTVARAIADEHDGHFTTADERAARAAATLSKLTDETLLHLDHFVEADDNHHPKLYLWLPGIALYALARRAGLPTDWLEDGRRNRADLYERLPEVVLQVITPARPVNL